MTDQTKSSQLQIRVSNQQKTAIQRAARRAGKDMSSYILAKVLPPLQERFDVLTSRLANAPDPEFYLAELNDFLSNVSAEQFVMATTNPPPAILSPFLANYVAAMVEYAAGRLEISPPSWTRRIPPLDKPVFGTDLKSLQLYLLTHSPAPFRKRNIFVDATLGDRV